MFRTLLPPFVTCLESSVRESIRAPALDLGTADPISLDPLVLLFPYFMFAYLGSASFYGLWPRIRSFCTYFRIFLFNFQCAIKQKTALVTLDSRSPSLNVSSVAKVVWCGVPCLCLSDTFLWDKRHDFVDGSPAHNNTLTYQP